MQRLQLAYQRVATRQNNLICSHKLIMAKLPTVTPNGGYLRVSQGQE